LWAAATIVRPNYLLAWLSLPLLAFALASRGTRARTVFAALAGAMIFGACAFWQYRICGEPGFLPAQGAYNLWAANRPGAHGRYYTQQISIPASLGEENPARVESYILFRHATGHSAENIRELNTYWRGRFYDYILHYPVAWAWQLLRKLYALFNDWEQYNNKTFAFHRARSPWLWWNPLSWGILVVLGVAGATRLQFENPRAARAIGIVFGVSIGSILLFFVSARFRLPLAALATILAGGSLAIPRIWHDWPAKLRWGLAGLSAAAAFLTFSRFDGVRDHSTFVQDHALTARAAATVGRDREAWEESRAALALQPNHPDALSIAVASYFNLLLIGAAPAGAEGEWSDLSARLLALQSSPPSLRAIAALSLWRSGQRSGALIEWQRLEQTPSALAARLLVEDASVSSSALQHLPADAWKEPLVQIARTLHGIKSTEAPEWAGPRDARVVARELFGVTASP
jgi:hypothetical protein